MYTFLSLSIYIYIHTRISFSLYIYREKEILVCIYIYIERERNVYICIQCTCLKIFIVAILVLSKNWKTLEYEQYNNTELYSKALIIIKLKGYSDVFSAMT